MFTRSNDIPNKLGTFLVEGEAVEHQFESELKAEKCQVYLTNMRLFVFKGMTVRDIDYRFISSIQIARKKNPWLIVVGVILVTLGVILFSELINIPLEGANTSAATVALILGFVLVLIGIFYTERTLELSVAGMTEPYQLSGQEMELESFFKLVREKQK